MTIRVTTSNEIIKSLQKEIAELKKQLAEKIALLNKQIQAFNSLQDSWQDDKMALLKSETALKIEKQWNKDVRRETAKEIFDFLLDGAKSQSMREWLVIQHHKFFGENQSQRTNPQVHGSNVDRRTDEIKSGLVDKTADTHSKSGDNQAREK